MFDFTEGILFYKRKPYDSDPVMKLAHIMKLVGVYEWMKKSICIYSFTAYASYSC